MSQPRPDSSTNSKQSLESLDDDLVQALPPLAVGGAPKQVKRRLKLWEIDDYLLCSVIGTCLTPHDLARVMKRHRLTFDHDAREHRRHSFFVEKAASDNPVSRSLGKILDEKFARTVRLVGAEEDAGGLEALWDDLCGKGQVAPAYWAFMCHGHVPVAVRNSIFGDVHMMSHYMGGHNRQNAKALWLAERRAEMLGERLGKARKRAQETLRLKEERIAELENELEATRHELAGACARTARSEGRTPGRAAGDPARQERRLSAARARIRLLDEENQRLRGLLEAVADHAPSLAPPSSVPFVDAGEALQVQDGDLSDHPCLEGRQLLYVGGRRHLLPHLKARAEACAACLLHHDGGKEETLKALDGLIDQADVVFCPIDCVSHQACLRAKLLCRRQAKPFVPLRSSSATCFHRAIGALWGKTPCGA